jgi:hypothetical protein
VGVIKRCPAALISGCIFFHAQPADQAPWATRNVVDDWASAEVAAVEATRPAPAAFRKSRRFMTPFVLADIPLSIWGLQCCSLRNGSAERERKNLHARTEKLDLELAIGDGFRLSDQLIETLFAHRAVALLVNVNAVSRARRLSIDQCSGFLAKSLSGHEV